MALKSYRPLTPVQRFKQTPAFDEITRWTPTKSLLEPKKKTGGRNNYGRLTSRHIGGGHKQHYRKVDFKRRKHGVTAEVLGISSPTVQREWRKAKAWLYKEVMK